MKRWIVLMTFSVLALVLSSCMRSQHTPVGSSYKILIAAKVDQPVEGGISAKTGSLGLVHLGKPLLAAEFQHDIHQSNFMHGQRFHFIDFSIESLEPQRVLNLPPTLFLNREGVKGMEADVILERLKSEELATGKQVYLIVETEANRVIFALRTTRLDHPDYVFIQKNFDYLKWDYNSRRGEYEVRQRKSEQDKDSTGFPRSPQSQTGDGSGEGAADEFLYAGEKLFKVTSYGWSSGMPSRVKIKNDGKSTGFSIEELQSLHGERVVLTWQTNDPQRLVGIPRALGRPSNRQQGSSSRQSSDSEEAYGDGIPRAAASAIFWSSIPGLHFEMDQPWRLDEIRRDIRNLGIDGLQWMTIDYSPGGVSTSGGSL